MRFSKIAITKVGVHLVRRTVGENGDVEETDLTSPENPLRAFVDALQAFKPYVSDLLDEFSLYPESFTVTTLSLSEDKNGRRGLIVTALVPIAKAYDKPVVINTPLVREGTEETSDEAFVLSPAVLELLALVEGEAMRYVNGAREQGDLFEAPSANAAEFNARAAAAEAATTRKPKKAKPPVDFVRGAGDVHNPEATEAPTDEKLVELLAAAGARVPLEAVATFTSTERDAAFRWARDPSGDTPDCVVGSMDLSMDLSLGSWNEPGPHVDDDQVQQLRAVAESGS